MTCWTSTWLTAWLLQSNKFWRKWHKRETSGKTNRKSRKPRWSRDDSLKCTQVLEIQISETQNKAIRDGEDDDDISGFYFENFLGLNLRVTLEDHDSWLDEGITLNEEQADAAVIVFNDWEEPGERNFRSLAELNALNKYIKKERNGGKLVDNIEDSIIRVNVYIPGFIAITGVPIDISGLRSYELKFKDESDKQAQKNKHQFSLVVNVKPEGVRKVVSFESQCIFTNQTEFDIEIAEVFPQLDTNLKPIMSK